MTEAKKILGEERRAFILQLLKDSAAPLTGSELASRTNVSRQVIVGDITLLKAKNEPIIATSQGYIYLNQGAGNPVYERTIACRHSPEDTEKELNIMVDHGVLVKDVKIEHAVYGDLTASIMVSNRQDVKQFMDKIRSTKAALLSELTGGIHLHTISAANEYAAKEYGLSLVQRNIHDFDYNHTRFVVLSEKDLDFETLSRSTHYKTTLMVTLPSDQAGALHQVLSAFAWRKLNLSKIESRPMKTGIGNYFFIIDVEMKLDEVLIPGAIAEMEALGCGVKLMGSYPSLMVESE